MNALAPALAHALPQPAPVVPPLDGDAPSLRRRRKQVWLALHFPDWPLHALLHRLMAEQRAQLAARPLVVLDEDRQRHVLVANELAQRQGIRAGHTLNAAMALCAELQALCRDLRAETALLTKLAAWAQQYTPVVSMEAPNELLLEVRGSLRLFGGVQQFMYTVQQALHARQLHAAMVLSPTVRASLCLARCIPRAESRVVTPRQLRSAMAPLPVACLHWPVEIQQRLMRCGVMRIGELWRLPRADLGRRIGQQYLREVDALSGRQPEVRAAFRAILPYTEQIPLDFEITSTALLETLLLCALQRLQVYLRTHDLALTRLQVELQHRSTAGAATCLSLGLRTPTSELRRMTVVLREQLARLQLRAPVQAVTLHAPRLLAAQGVSQDFLAEVTQHRPPQSQTELLARLLERLQARLGGDAVRRLCLQHDYRPECAQSFKPVALESLSTVSAPHMLPARPLWLLPAPVMLSSGKLPVEWQIRRGPERIEAGWWDDAPIRRDYYVACHRNQSWAWVFKDLLQSGWYVHGWFA